MSNRAISPSLSLIFFLILAISLIGCMTSPGHESVELGAIHSATEAYLAYERGDCEGVQRAVSREEIEAWQASELRQSLLLVHGFCQEQTGATDEAVETYRALIRDAPLSFASDDARERLRILRLTRNDPEYASWVAKARDRATSGSSERMPVDRVPADFPPLAQQAGIEGYVVVEFGVTPRGDTDAPVVVDSQPPLLFDGTALRAVREWRYARDPNSEQSKRQAIRMVFKREGGETLPDPSDASSAETSDPGATLQ